MTARAPVFGGSVAGGLLVLAACGAPAPERLVPAEPVIVVGDFANPPFSSYDDAGNPVGLEVDILDEVGERVGRPIVWRETPFSEMLPAVASGEAHVAASTVGITDERARIVRFSEPYYTTELSVVVRVGAGEPQGLADLAGRRVGAGRATTSEGAVLRSLPDAEGVFDRKEETTFNAMLLGGEIDALAMDRPAAERFVGEHPDEVRRLDEHLGQERYAFAVHPGETDLLAAINAVIRDYRADGRL